MGTNTGQFFQLQNASKLHNIHRLVSDLGKLRPTHCPTLLKAGSVVQISGPRVNNEAAVWGDGAKEFDPSHFSSEPQRGGKSTPRTRPRPTSFMSFGASPNLCPGRHFAAAEVLSLVAMLLLRADIGPTKGFWWSPRLNAWAVAATVSPPGEAYPVEITARAEYKGAEWSFVVEGEKDRFDLITG
jgi:hypothetical protein